MSGDHQDISTESVAESEFYVEPTPMTPRDVAGVVVALVALALIGFGGYVWLNPKLSMADLLASKPVKDQPQSGEIRVTTAEDIHGDNFQDPALYADPPPEDTSCPQCGMYADRSEAHIRTEWSDGTVTHHDCWDCVFKWERSSGLQLKYAMVSCYGCQGSKPTLTADTALYLYQTKALKGSMPPYVAAFPDREAALGAQSELGGEIVDWEGLQAKFNK